MVQFINKVSKKKGLPPGTPVFIGKRKIEKLKIQLIDYTEKKFQEKSIKKVEECFPFKSKPTITWININGLHEAEVIEKIGKHFELHPLIIEDIVNTNQRPKIEDFEKYIFIVLKMIYYNEKKELVIEQISLILGNNFVISFQETDGDVFDYVRERLRKGKGKIRKLAADYLAYALIDAIVDNYFLVLEKIGDDIENIEEEVMKNPNQATINKIHVLKRELIFIRRSIWPLREVISNLQRGESKLINKTTNIYLRDIYDHTIQVVDTIENFRDMVSGMVDIYLSSVSNRMNEVMKVLTIFASIFIPLTFIAGVYGMNFQYMPELSWKYGYAFVWVIILAIGISTLFYFKRKKWI